MSATRTETLAMEALFGTGETDPGLLNRLLTLTSGEPTTEELQEALGLVEREIPAVLKAWLSSRNLINGHRVMTGPKAEALTRALNGIPTETDAEREELDRIERAHPAAGLITAFDKDLAS